MPKRSTALKALLIGAAAAVAIIASPPIVSAEPPSPNDQEQPTPPPDPAAIAGSAVDTAADNASKLPPISPYPTTGPPGGVCMRMNGFPIYIPPGGIPSEMASSGVPSGPVHAGVCTAEDTALPKVADTATDIVDAAVPAPPSEQQPPPPGQ